MNKVFKYKVNLVPFSIKNQEQNSFRDELNAIPYLLYEVELLKSGDKIVINKPGGKRKIVTILQKLVVGFLCEDLLKGSV